MRNASLFIGGCGLFVLFCFVFVLWNDKGECPPKFTLMSCLLTLLYVIISVNLAVNLWFALCLDDVTYFHLTNFSLSFASFEIRTCSLNISGILDIVRNTLTGEHQSNIGY